jgi:alkanesulfonate monooxygenase SsuD/methylene tetrahydromethanopterin reductase-like flavin-dependent oxidoreductase (luciferase family)
MLTCARGASGEAMRFGSDGAAWIAFAACPGFVNNVTGRPALRKPVTRRFIVKVGYVPVVTAVDETKSDLQLYEEAMALADMAEPLGFDSLWSLEHHFTGYSMIPNPVQFLTYFAARTRTIRLGTAVIVLPWHDPVRVAEQVSVLDHYSNGRVILGLGRGLARIEFEGFRVALDESRERFVEYATMILRGLEQGFVEFDGRYLQQPRRDIRPKPLKSFRGRTYAAAVSPESSRIMARLGIGILIIPQKPWDAVAQELTEYRQIYKQVNGGEPLPTIAAGWVFCDKNAARAREMAVKYIGGYWQTAIRHYEMTGAHFGKAKGYEYYSAFSKALEGGVDAATEYFLGLQIWGTPEQCFEKIDDVRKRVNADQFTGVFSYAGMPYEEAERNVTLFAQEVMPELKKLNGIKAEAA